MERHEISEDQWCAIRARWPQQRGPRNDASDRRFINAVVWLARTGIPWRDLPEHFGKWKSIYNRFRNWAAREGWMQVFVECVAVERHAIGGIIDASIIRAHQHAVGGRGGMRANALGRSRGGYSSFDSQRCRHQR